jgi:hypothetical protein
MAAQKFISGYQSDDNKSTNKEQIKPNEFSKP